MEILTGSTTAFYNYVSMRLYMADSQWENVHGEDSNIMLDWIDFEELARKKFEGKTAEIEEELQTIDPTDHLSSMQTYEEIYDMVLGNSNYLDNDYEAKKLFDEMNNKYN